MAAMQRLGDKIRTLFKIRQEGSPLSLAQELRSWQIFTILISGIIGVTIFASNGQYLRTAGPAGFLTAVAYVGLNAIFVMECLGEFVVLWPVANAMVTYVHTFVDEELALVVGVAYWYAWASVIATMFVAAANFASYWDLPKGWEIGAFYVMGPLIIGVINCLGVKYFGYVEAVLGSFKLLFVLGAAIFLFIAGAHNGSSCTFRLVPWPLLVVRTNNEVINAGYHADEAVTSSPFTAVLLVIPFLTYGFLGVELISVTAFEARARASLRFSAKYIAWIITFMFVICGVGEALNVSWNDDELPRTSAKRANLATRAQSQAQQGFSILVLAAERDGQHHTASVWNAFLIVSCISAANTALYVASRTLYGLCRNLEQHEGNFFRGWLAVPGRLDPRTRVPFWAIFISVVAFVWLPFLHTSKGYSVQSLLEVMITIGSVGCVLVWASQCLAYIRYHRWIIRHKSRLGELIRDDEATYAKYDRNNMDNSKRFHTILGPGQPAWAYGGLVMCFLTVFVFSSVTWWKTPPTARKVASAYAGPVFCLGFWINLKLHRCYKVWKDTRDLKDNPRKFALWTDLSKNEDRFRQILADFEGLLEMRAPEPESRSTSTLVSYTGSKTAATTELPALPSTSIGRVSN